MIVAELHPLVLIESCISRREINFFVSVDKEAGGMKVPFKIASPVGVKESWPNSEASGSCKNGEEYANLYFPSFSIRNATSICSLSVVK